MKIKIYLLLILVQLASCSNPYKRLININREFSEKDFEYMVTTIVDTMVKSMILESPKKGFIDTIIVNPSIRWTRFMLYGLSENNFYFYPTMDLEMPKKELEHNRPVLLTDKKDNHRWHQNFFYVGFYQPVISDDFSVSILLQTWHQGGIFDRIYTFQKASGKWKMKSAYFTVTEHFPIRRPLEDMPELTEEQMNKIREKMRNLPVKIPPKIKND